MRRGGWMVMGVRGAGGHLIVPVILALSCFCCPLIVEHFLLFFWGYIFPHFCCACFVLMFTLWWFIFVLLLPITLLLFCCFVLLLLCYCCRRFPKFMLLLHISLFLLFLLCLAFVVLSLSNISFFSSVVTSFLISVVLALC